MQQPTLYYDGDCGICTRWALWLESHSDVSVRPSQWYLDELGLIGVTPEIASLFVIYVDPSQNVALGHRAISHALQQVGGVYGIFGKLLSVKQLDKLWIKGYQLLARNRHRLPGGTPMCAPQRNTPSRI